MLKNLHKTVYNDDNDVDVVVVVVVLLIEGAGIMLRQSLFFSL